MRRVVITGLGAVSPVGNTAGEMFDNLMAGKSGIGSITRFDTTGMKCTVAAEVKDFDPLLYMEKNAARKMDLFSQFAMAAAVQAMEDAKLTGYDPTRLGVYVGSGIGGFHTFVSEHEKLLEKGPNRVSPHFIPMMISNLGAGNIAIRFNAQGPCLPVVSACSTGANAVGEALRAIQYGHADYILAGGSEAAIEPLSIAGFCACMALTSNSDPATACRPFDKNRDGFVMGEGAGVLLLEELEHALARGAHIYAELAGYGNTCDAHHVTAPQPEAEGAIRCLKLALAEAGLDGSEALYINAHGTSTPLNDKMETKAFKAALGEDNARNALISSTKSMTGHMLGAAGGVEALVCALALERGQVPPTMGLAEADEECDLNYVPGHGVEAPITAALSTSFGFGGHNAALALRKFVK